MSKKKLILVGGGGHCKSVIEAIESEGIYAIAGILDVKEKVGQGVLGYEILGTDEDIPELVKTYPHFIITAGQIQSAALRKKLFTLVKKAGGHLPVIKASTARVSAHASVGEGTVILHHALVNAGAQIGENVIVNSAAIIEHEAQIGAHSHISTAAVVNGNVKIGREVFVGSNSTLKQGIELGDEVIVGAGSLVLSSFPGKLLIVGSPAKIK